MELITYIKRKLIAKNQITATSTHLPRGVGVIYELLSLGWSITDLFKAHL